MRLPILTKQIALLVGLIFVSSSSIASENIFKQARELQRDGDYTKAIETYKKFLSQATADDELTDQQFTLYTEALVQLMNSYQSCGEAEACVKALKETFHTSRILQTECLRDYYSILGYALSRTEAMAEAEATMLKVFTLPLHRATPERFFRDYAYAAAVFYSNPNYQDEVVIWCKEALTQAKECKNNSGAQWVKTMLGSHYKRYGELNEALELFTESKEEAQRNGDNLGTLNSLNALIDLMLYWEIPEYANICASEAVRVEQRMTAQNPMISAQTYINKGRALHALGECDSVALYTDRARNICESLSYNSGMVDVNLLHGTLLTDRGGDSLHRGIEELEQVIAQGTTANRARAYHQLAKTYLREENRALAEVMLDSLYTLLTAGNTPIHIDIDYQTIINHYLGSRNHTRVEQYTTLMLAEQQAFSDKKLNYNLVESIVELKSKHKRQELKIDRLKQANERLWLLICITMSLATISTVVTLLYRQRRRYRNEMRRVEERFALVAKELDQSNEEKERVTQEIKELLRDHDNRQELETLTPHILKDSGETKFRQCFELLHPLFLHRLRERVPSITRREELLSMLILLKQDNKVIAELLAIAPRSVLMLRHRFRQKIGLATEYSLENFIEDTLQSGETSTEVTSEQSNNNAQN